MKWNMSQKWSFFFEIGLLVEAVVVLMTSSEHLGCTKHCAKYSIIILIHLLSNREGKLRLHNCDDPTAET